MANDFYKRFKVEKLPALRYSSGEIGVYDPKSNIYGLYDKNGRTITFYKPTSPTYFERQIEKQISKGGEVINKLPKPESTTNSTPKKPTSGGGRSGGGGRGGGGMIDLPKIPGNRSKPIF